MESFLFPVVKVIVSMLLDCMLIEEEVPGRAIVIKSITALDFKPVLSLSREWMPREA